MTSKELKKIREILGLSHQELAKAVNRKHKQQVNNWEKGDPIPPDVPEKIKILVAAHLKKMPKDEKYLLTWVNS